MPTSVSAWRLARRRLLPAIVRDEVIRIRQDEAPQPEVLGNAGSFFMNPIISAEAFERLREAYPEAPHYDLPDGQVKVPAGWLIDAVVSRAIVSGDAAVYERQALVLVEC